MVPITGPFVREITGPTTSQLSLYEKVSGYKQQPPFTLALPYSRLISNILSYSGVSTSVSAFNHAGITGTYNDAICNFRTLTGLNGTIYQKTIARATSWTREKMAEELSDKIELLVSLAERRDAYAMVLKRMTDLYRFVRALRHPNAKQMRQFFTGSSLPRPFKETLKYRLKNWRSVAKDLGGAWLEFHFGWEPIVKDIDSLLQLISGPISEATIEVKSAKLPFHDGTIKTRTNPFDQTISGYEGQVQAFASATVKVDDVSKAYQSVLGLNNPVLVAYSLIPFTWMLDWVNYLGSYISQFSDMAGYKVLSASYSWKCTASGFAKREYPKGTIQQRNSWSGVYFERMVGIPRITLGWRPLPNRLSVSRGTTLAALLAIKFKP